MRIEFAEKRVFVSGSTSGIDFAAAKGFLAAGASVVVNGRSDAGVGSGGRTAEVRRRRCNGVRGRPRPRRRLRAPACRAFPASTSWSTISAYAYPVSSRQFRTNVLSGARLARAYAGAMADRGWGRIVFVSSESALNTSVDAIHYGATKAAQIAVSRGLAKRLAGTGVTVNAVLPGPTLSDGMAKALQPEADRSGQSLEAVASSFVAKLRPSLIIRRAATVDEVASMILYVCSAQASSTTGAALRVDGGVVDTIA